MKTLNTQAAVRQNGIVLGNLIGFENDVPLVVFNENPDEVAQSARSVCLLQSEDVGAEIAISFENGNLRSPIILGKIAQRAQAIFQDPGSPEVILDNAPPQTLELTAERELTLRCGKASITLTKEGKIILRGTYISSRSSGPNRIKGGSVHLN